MTEPNSTESTPSDAPQTDDAADLTRRAFLTTGLLATGFALAASPAGAETITTDTDGMTAGEVRFTSFDGKEIPVYLATPKDGKNLPVVLVVQEIFGVHEHIKDVCRRFAKRGHIAIAPELFFRQGDVSKLKEFSEIRGIVGKVPDAQVMKDLDGAVAHVKKTNTRADTAKLGITGFCWGGRIVWLYAAHNPKLKAGAAWYGRVAGQPAELQPKSPTDVAEKIKTPILGLYGAKDGGIPVATLDALKDKLKASGNTKSEIVVYPDAEHGFHADYRPSYNEAAAKDGFAKLLVWFKTHGAA